MSKLPLMLGDDFLDKTPPQYSGGVLANMLGYNIIRTIYHNIGRLKPKKIKKEYIPYLEKINEDGILVIPDFFSKEQFEEIKKEYDDAYAGWSPVDIHPEEFSKRQKDFPEYFNSIAEKIVTPVTPAFTKYIVENELINEITTAVVNRKERIAPYKHFWYLKRRSLGNENEMGIHSAGYPHADVSYPTIKVFMYLNDVDEQNAAYIFAKGSHKMSLKRLILEYKFSIRFAKDNMDVSTKAEDIEYLGCKSESITGKANTLIISNNMGYHNRGIFHNLDPRQTAQLDFRNLETWRNSLYRNEKDLVSRISRKIVKTLDKAKKEKLRANISHNNMS
ncbi:MAG: phytanoyl-CoA dioxygenase family protein [Ignavibacteria bacterium]|nr:phytanoyl-CoA dioxygenase family protein [Ignavibacteria bacterium]